MNFGNKQCWLFGINHFYLQVLVTCISIVSQLVGLVPARARIISQTSGTYYLGPLQTWIDNYRINNLSQNVISDTFFIRSIFMPPVGNKNNGYTVQKRCSPYQTQRKIFDIDIILIPFLDWPLSLNLMCTSSKIMRLKFKPTIRHGLSVVQIIWTLASWSGPSMDTSLCCQKAA